MASYTTKPRKSDRREEAETWLFALGCMVFLVGGAALFLRLLVGPLF